MSQEEGNFTEEEFLQEIKDLVYKLEDEDESLRETRRRHLLQLLEMNGIFILSKEIIDSVLYYKVAVRRQNINNNI